MARSFQINGETMVTVKGRSDSNIGSLQQLGLADSPIQVSLEFRHKDLKVDAWGNGEVPPEVQFMLASATITMRLIHFDRDVLDVCLAESMAYTTVGTLPRTGALMGNGLARFAAGGAAGNHYIGLNLSSPVGSKPWRFLTSYLANNPMAYPLGTDSSAVDLTWRVIPYTTDPWGSGAGSQGAVLWDYVADS